MRIFLDIGANKGQTLAAVLDPVFRFDWIVCFEPSKVCLPKLADLADDRVMIQHFGLWNQTCFKTLIDPGGKGASIYDKDNVRPNAETELCKFRRASEWFKHCLGKGHTVFMKLNCEGAECDILDDLLDSGEFEKVSYAMIDFDVRKIAAQKHREAELRERLSRFAFPRVAYSKDVMVGPTHQDRIKNWLRLVGAGS